MALYRCMASGGQMSETVLWTNPDPSSSSGFASQTVTLSDNIDNYDFICVEYARGYRYLDTKSKVYYKVSDYKTFAGGSVPKGIFRISSYYRTFIYGSNIQVVFHDCYATSGTETAFNTYCTPLNIYGCK